MDQPGRAASRLVVRGASGSTGAGGVRGAAGPPLERYATRLALARLALAPLGPRSGVCWLGATDLLHPLLGGARLATAAMGRFVSAYGHPAAHDRSWRPVRLLAAIRRASKL